jgi:soluble lytic murein transglycosylase-like protein
MIHGARRFQTQQCLAVSHAGNESGAALGAGTHRLAEFLEARVERRADAHEMMLASDFTEAQQLALVFRNKTVYICFLVAMFMMAASPMRAADVPAPVAVAASAPGADPVPSTTFVVRADPRTGKLVRRAVTAAPASVKPAAKPSPDRPAPKSPGVVKPDISALVEEAARTHDVDPLLIHSVIAVESNYDSHAVSPKGAEGLMQLMPPTARMLGISNSFDPRQNIEAGVRYLKYLQDLYKDDTLALAAYNAGPKAVEKFKSVPPYRETQNYVDQVGKRYDQARKSAAVPAAGPAAKDAAPVPPANNLMPVEPVAEEDKHPKLEQFVDQNGRLHLKTSQ